MVFNNSLDSPLNFSFGKDRVESIGKYVFNLSTVSLHEFSKVNDSGFVMGAERHGHGYGLPCKNSRVKKSGIEFLLPSVYSISKSKMLKMDCHLAKICLLAIFLTSFPKTYLALLQSTLTKNF